MSSVTDQYTKNYSPERTKEFEERVREIFVGDMSEESAASLIAAEFRKELKKGGRVRMASGGIANILKL
tara:strand:- start:710 stop:916 length:207 start_codon:yes stop_codon:yes gene_type:complete